MSRQTTPKPPPPPGAARRAGAVPQADAAARADRGAAGPHGLPGQAALQQPVIPFIIKILVQNEMFLFVLFGKYSFLFIN